MRKKSAFARDTEWNQGDALKASKFPCQRQIISTANRLPTAHNRLPTTHRSPDGRLVSSGDIDPHLNHGLKAPLGVTIEDSIKQVLEAGLDSG